MQFPVPLAAAKMLGAFTCQGIAGVDNSHVYVWYKHVSGYVELRRVGTNVPAGCLWLVDILPMLLPVVASRHWIICAMHALIGPYAPLATGLSLGCRYLAILLFLDRRAPPGRLALGSNWELLLVVASLLSPPTTTGSCPLQIWLRALATPCFHAVDQPRY